MPRCYRTGLLWLHLVVGVLSSVPIILMAATGVVMSFRPEVIDWFERDVEVVDRAGPRLPPTDLIHRAKRELPFETKLESLQLERVPTAPAILGSEVGFWLLDPYDGHVLRTSAIRHFFLAVEEVHWTAGLVLVGMRRTGTAVAGLVAIGVLLLSLSGPLLSQSRVQMLPGPRKPVLFSRTSGHRARSFKWHHILGVCCMPVILAASLTGILLHYEVARAGVREFLGKTEDAQVMLDADSAVREAVTRAPDWSALRLWWTEDGVMTLRVRFTRGIRPTEWAELATNLPDASGGSKVTLRRYQDGRGGDKLLGWARWVHTGQALGHIGQAAWGLAALSILVLVWTGIALTLGRAHRWRTNRSRKDPVVPAR